MQGMLSINMSTLLKSLMTKAINDNGFKVDAIRLEQERHMTIFKFTIEYDIVENDVAIRTDSKSFDIKFVTVGLFSFLNDNRLNSLFLSLDTHVKDKFIESSIRSSYDPNTKFNFKKGIQ